MKMTKKYRRICAVITLSALCGAGILNARSGSTSVRADYRDINITYNGTQKTVTDEHGTPIEPFAVNGSVYVPLRGVGEIFGANVSWEPTTNTVAINGGSTNSSTSEAAYIEKITELQNQLNAANAEIASLKNNNNNSNSNTGNLAINTTTLNETANRLYQNYSDGLGSGIDLGFELTQKGSRLQLTISYSSSAEDTKFDKCSESKIKSFIKSVCEEIVARHGDVAIQGEIKYTKSDISKTTFTVSTSGTYSYDFGMTESSIQDIISYTTDNRFDLGSPLGYQNIYDIEATVKNGRIAFTITLNASDKNLKDNKWNDNLNTISSKARTQLRNIVKDIEDEANGDYIITGTVQSYDNTELFSIDRDRNVDSARSL